MTLARTGNGGGGRRGARRRRSSHAARWLRPEAARTSGLLRYPALPADVTEAPAPPLAVSRFPAPRQRPPPPLGFAIPTLARRRGRSEGTSGSAACDACGSARMRSPLPRCSRFLSSPGRLRVAVSDVRAARSDPCRDTGYYNPNRWRPLFSSPCWAVSHRPRGGTNPRWHGFRPADAAGKRAAWKQRRGRRRARRRWRSRGAGEGSR